MVVFSKTKQGPFELYEFFVGKDNFQHLAGVRYPKGAEAFFDKCFHGVAEWKDIVPAKSIGLTSVKIEVLPDAIDLRNGKLYKIGKKDLWTEFNKFSIVIGNVNSVMGIDKREYYLPIPVTVVKDSITKHCSDFQNIFLIMTKNIDDDMYTDILYEKTTDILHKAMFPVEILKKICPDMFSE